MSGPSVGGPAQPSDVDLLAFRRLMTGYRVSQAIYVAARLRIADALKDGPRSSDAVAEMTGAHADSLYRLLRFLAGVGLFDEVAPRRFALSPVGAGLRSDGPNSWWAMTLFLLDDFQQRPWGQLLHSVQTGEPAFRHVHGVGLFDYLGEHPDLAALFHRALASHTATTGDALVREYDFAGFERVVDVGGGHGALLAAVLRAHPRLRGVLFDLPDVAAGALPGLEAAGVADRCDIVGGDFFDAVLPAGDAYLLQQIIHDWDDSKAAAILRQCRRVIRPTGKLLVVDRLVAADPREALPVLQGDLEMLVIVGGRERTGAEFRALFADAGFRLHRTVPLGEARPFCVFEGNPA